MSQGRIEVCELRPLEAADERGVAIACGGQWARYASRNPWCWGVVLGHLLLMLDLCVRPVAYGAMPRQDSETGTETNTAAQAARGRDRSDSALRKEPRGEHPKSEVIVNEEKVRLPAGLTRRQPRSLRRIWDKADAFVRANNTKTLADPTNTRVLGAVTGAFRTFSGALGKDTKNVTHPASATTRQRPFIC